MCEVPGGGCSQGSLQVAGRGSALSGNCGSGLSKGDKDGTCFVGSLRCGSNVSSACPCGDRVGDRALSPPVVGFTPMPRSLGTAFLPFVVLDVGVLLQAFLNKGFFNCFKQWLEKSPSDL